MIYPPAGAKTKKCPKCGGLMWVRSVEYFGLCFSRDEWCCSELDCDYSTPAENAPPLPIEI